MDWINVGLSSSLALLGIEVIRLFYRVRRQQERLDFVERRVGDLMLWTDKSR